MATNSRSNIYQADEGGVKQWNQVEKGSETYYSGLDASVYIGVNGSDLYLGEIVALQYELQEQVLPLVRYSDYTFSRAQHGVRIAHGSFTINFQQTYLISMILEYMRQVQEGTTTSNSGKSGVGSRRSKGQTGTSTVPPVNMMTSSLTNLLGNSSDASLITDATEVYIKNRTPTNLNLLVNTLNTVTSKQKTNSTINNLIDQSKRNHNWLQGQLSGEPNSTSIGSTLLARTKDSLTPLYSRFDAGNGFNMSIAFGDMTKQQYVQTYQKPDPENIYVPKSFAQIHKEMADAIAKNSLETALDKMPGNTFRRIHGIEITGFTQGIDDSGRPLLETYFFIAKDII